MNVLATLLNDALTTGARKAKFAFVDVNAAFEGHRFCDSDFWFQEFIKSFSIHSLFHHTRDGQNAFLKTLEHELGC